MSYRQPFKGDYPITQTYGATDTSAFHTGIDYACPIGTPILASNDGRVVECGWDRTGYGYKVVIYHADGNGTLYAHLNSITVITGQKVAQGAVIGYSGSTGNSTGPHLHFEARRTWTDYKSHFDPMDLPLQSFADFTEPVEPKPVKPYLKEADQLGDHVMITAPLGAWAWAPDFSKRQTVYQQGTRLRFTGRTTQRLGYTYAEVYPEPVTYWVAIHDGETQILDNGPEKV